MAKDTGFGRFKRTRVQPYVSKGFEKSKKMTRPPPKYQVAKLRSRPFKETPTRLAPGDKEFLNYSSALFDPWNAPFDVGIPYGGSGLPTFKSTKMFCLVMSTSATTATSTTNGCVVPIGAHCCSAEICLYGDGNCGFYAATGNAVTGVLQGNLLQMDHGRLVASSICCQRMGRHDDAGLTYGMTRQCYDGIESFPTFTREDDITMNYHPKSN